MTVKLPLGIENFKELREEGCYYVDKTGLIEELLEQTFKVNLITRPRRFGKTLTMSMLAEFFDITKDSRKIFEGLKISRCTDICKKWLNQWPVLFLSLKDVSGREFSGAYGLLKQEISKLCISHAYLETSSAVDETDRNSFIRLKNRNGDEIDVKCALDTLLRMMNAHFSKPVILLIDEYDVPLAKAADNGYYDEMLDVVRTLLGMTWKTNASLKFAVVTGCLRLAKESIFTGANNFISNSVSGERYNSCFGFLETEVKQLLDDVCLPEYLKEMKKWYDGYVFGGREVYCPWDVLNHVSVLMLNPKTSPANYWKDTSHNEIIRKFIDHPEIAVNDKFELLLSGGIIQESIVEDLTYDILHSTESNLWSILYLTGYLTQGSLAASPGKVSLRIPNEEVKTIFADTVAEWFGDSVVRMNREGMFAAWWNGEEKILNELVMDILFSTISYFDYKEDYYHAFVTGLFAGAGYDVVSNSEMGKGRPDIVVKDRKNRRALIIEVKHSRSEKVMQQDCRKAFAQIETGQYARQFLKGYKTILCYGAAFFEKTCLIQKVEKTGRSEGAVYEIV